MKRVKCLSVPQFFLPCSKPLNSTHKTRRFLPVRLPGVKLLIDIKPGLWITDPEGVPLQPEIIVGEVPPLRLVERFGSVQFNDLKINRPAFPKPPADPQLDLGLA